MPQQINLGFYLNAPATLDARYTKTVSGHSVPYTDTDEACTAIPSAYRCIGLTVLVLVDGEPLEYWWKDGLDDEDLIEKTVAAGWQLEGNTGTDETLDFIGTTDTQNLVFKVNNFSSGLIDRASITGFGYKTLLSNEAINATAFGYLALTANTTGVDNTAFGYKALTANTIGLGNVAIGSNALLSNSVGQYNVALGIDAMHSAVSSTNSIAIGRRALYATGSDYSTIAIGSGSLSAINGGAGNIVIGTNSGNTLTTAEGCIILGNGMQLPDESENQLIIGYNGTTWIKGDAGVITIPDLAGTGERVTTANVDGVLSATVPIVEAFVTDSQVITAITGATYNSGNNYKSAISPASAKIFYQGQMYETGANLYIAVADNVSRRFAGG